MLNWSFSFFIVFSEHRPGSFCSLSGWCSCCCVQVEANNRLSSSVHHQKLLLNGYCLLCFSLYHLIDMLWCQFWKQFVLITWELPILLSTQTQTKHGKQNFLATFWQNFLNQNQFSYIWLYLFGSVNLSAIRFQVNSAFNGKRKMLRKSLQHICSSPEIEAALCGVGLPPTVSAGSHFICLMVQFLSISQYTRLFHIINSGKTRGAYTRGFCKIA